MPIERSIRVTRGWRTRTYSAAEKLYIAPLLAGEPPAEWNEIHAARLAAMHGRALARMEALIGGVNSDEIAQYRSILVHELSA